MERNTLLMLKEKAAKVRMLSVEAVYGAKSGHPGGSLSIADVITYLYFHKMNVNPADPAMESRDRFVLSKGHACPSLYALLALKGFFDVSELKNLKSLNASYNCIEDVSPISQMTELVYLDLTQNPIKDLSSLTNFNPEKFEKIILDLNTLIKDWSPLDYLGNKVQGKPTPTELKKMAEQNIQ